MLARERRDNELRADGIAEGIIEGKKLGIAEGKRAGIEEGLMITLNSFIAKSKQEGLDDEQILKNVKNFLPDAVKHVNVDEVKRLIREAK